MEENPHLRRSLENEYTQVPHAWSFLTGIRFALLAFAGTILSVLLGGFRTVVLNAKSLQNLSIVGQVAIPAFGLAVTLAIMLIEWRTRKLYGACLDRGIDIEESLGMQRGMFRRIHSSGRAIGAITHTHAIYFIYGSICVAWWLLFLRGFVIAAKHLLAH